MKRCPDHGGQPQKGYDLPRWAIAAPGWRGIALVGVRSVGLFARHMPRLVVVS